MKHCPPCPHCQQDNPIVYEDALYCGNCNTAYPVYKRVYAMPDLKAGYLRMRDYATEITETVQAAYERAGVQPTPEVIAMVQRTNDMAEQYDEWGNG